MAKSSRQQSHPVKNLGSIFQVRRDLAREIERTVMKGCPLPIDMADILIDLYGARRLGWPEPIANKDGFVTVRVLRDGLVHSGALLSMRLKKLKATGYLEVEKIPQTGPASQYRQGPRSSRSWVRIRPEGEKLAKELWARYEKLGERLLANVPPSQRAAHLAVNAAISFRAYPSNL